MYIIFITLLSSRLVKTTLSNLTLWIHKYITSQEDSEYIDDDTKPHAVFYSVCQAFFHLFVARYKHFVESKNGKCILFIICVSYRFNSDSFLKTFFFLGILFLQNLDIPKIVTCKLNPLKMCDMKIVHDFANVTSMYQLAYCFTVIENNERNRLPVFGMKTHLPVLVPNFFPFESYTLEQSGRRITPLFRNNVMSIDSQQLVKECK